MVLSPENVSYLLGLGGLGSIIFGVVNAVKKPQSKVEHETTVLRDDFKTLKAVVDEIKEKHLASVEENIKELSGSVHGLALNVTRLATIIDERIPKTK